MTPPTMRDFLTIYRLQRQGVRLDLKGSLLYPTSPIYDATASSLPGFWSDRVLTVVIREQGRSGFVQARWRGVLPVLDLLFIAPSLDTRHGTTWLWQRLVHELVNVGAQSGAQRLFTQLPEKHHAEIEVMRQSGFAIYGQDRLYRLDKLPLLVKSGKRRWQVRRSLDDWGLKRLYLALTPDVVQQAESVKLNGRNSYVGWCYNRHRKSFVLRGKLEGEVFAYLSLTRGKLAHWLKLVVHPERVNQSSVLLEQALYMMRTWPEHPIYCDVRDYEGFLPDALERVGFTRMMTRTLLVRHITANIRVKATQRRLLLEAAPETAPSSF